MCAERDNDVGANESVVSLRLVHGDDPPANKLAVGITIVQVAKLFRRH
jgi:hypothetical protein